ncbi:hypothetical protein MTO96_016886 [Rhipicephalus appendiculatus]
MRTPTWSLLLSALTIYNAFCEELAFKPGCTREQLTSCGSDYLVYSNVTTLPEGGKEFEEYCVYLQMQLTCTQEFAKKCLDGVPRAAIIIALQSMEDEYEAICTEGTEQNENYQKSIACLNKAGQRHQPMPRQAASHNGDRGSGCTSGPVHRLRLLDCFGHALENCSGTPAKEFMTNLLEKVFGEPLSLICGQYTRDSDACRTLPKLAPPADSKDFGKKGFIELAIEHAGAAFNRH